MVAVCGSGLRLNLCADQGAHTSRTEAVRARNTSAGLAAEFGEDRGATSCHLRQLARFGFNTGPSPADRRKTGSKHHLICDGRGTPLKVITTAANVIDVTQTLALVDGIPPVARRPGRPRRRPCTWVALLPLFALTSSPAQMAAIGAACAFIGTLWNAVIITYTTVLVPNELLGRVTSAAMTLSSGGHAAGLCQLFRRPLG
ncbi:transposase [Streptomyces sp. 2A115]|uniref:transposase n=1 Tax=Streptomyces sp. 2A115 TaxID=3457439 RepID=UPI003FD1BC67